MQRNNEKTRQIVSTTLFKKEQRYHSSPSSDAPLNDITMPSNDSSRIDSEVQNFSPLTSESTTLNLQADQRR